MESMGNSIWLADFCPICMRKVIPSTVLEELRKKLVEEGLEKALKIVYKVPEVARLDILLPRQGLEFLEGSPVIYPLCKDCSRLPRTRQFRESIESNIKNNKHMLNRVEGFDIKAWASRPREGRCVF